MSYFHVGPTVKIASGAGEYQHRFGGQPQHTIRGVHADATHVHCLYLLDCHDPDLPSVIRGRRWLPLYYPLFNNACDFAYQIHSDTEIEIHLVSDGPENDFPCEDYPASLPEHAVHIQPLTYEQEKTLVYYFNAEFELSSDCVSSADKEFVRALGYPFTQIGGIQYMTQGRPERECPNPKCEYHKFSNMHTIFGVVWNNPVPDFQIWGEYGDFSQLIFQICPKCPTIWVCNRCD
jgi:hypothetical protein